MNKAFWLYSLWVSVLCAIFFHIYGYSGMTIGWMAFIILAIFFGTGSKAKDFPALFCSMAAGLVWGQLNFIFIGLMDSMGLSPAAGMFVGITVMTTLAMGTHLTILGKTLFNRVPLVFAGVALTFSQGGQNPLGIGLTLTGGLMLAVACSLGEGYIFSRFAEEQNNETLENTETM